MQQWEYKVVERIEVTQENLNQWGAEGWELMDFVLPHCNVPNTFDELQMELVLRRALTEQD